MRAVSALQTLDLSGTSKMLFALGGCDSGRIRHVLHLSSHALGEP